MSQSPPSSRREDPRMHTVEMAALPEHLLVGEPPAADAAARPTGRRMLGLVAAGGALGALLRAGLDLLLPTVVMATQVGIPWATLIANTLGCLAMGTIGGLVEARRHLPAWVQPFVVTGLLGGFTTMALVLLQFSVMIGADVPLLALEYAVVTIVLPLASTVLGLLLGGVLGRARPVSGSRTGRER